MRRLSLILLLVLTCSIAGERTVRAQKPTEYQVKAAYLYNFARFVTWPPSAPQGDFNICVLGDDPFGEDLKATIAGEKIQGREVKLRNVRSEEAAAGCHIVFISPSEKRRFTSLLPGLLKHRALVVSDIPDFCDRGGTIGFVLDGERVRFEVNLESAKQAELTLSSDLLKVASRVRTASAKGGR